MSELFRGFYRTPKGRHTITLYGKPIVGECLYWDSKMEIVRVKWS